MIVGNSGSGKSTLAKALAQRIAGDRSRSYPLAGPGLVTTTGAAVAAASRLICYACKLMLETGIHMV
jgi:ABC-type glutathione transport system ATPase component